MKSGEMEGHGSKSQHHDEQCTEIAAIVIHYVQLCLNKVRSTKMKIKGSTSQRGK